MVLATSSSAPTWPSPATSTQSHVIRVARACLRDAPPGELSLKAISRAAHHSASTLVYQFGSLEGLYAALFVDIGLEVAEFLDPARAPVDVCAFDYVADRMITWVAEEPRATDFLLGHPPAHDLASRRSDRCAEPLWRLLALFLPEHDRGGQEPEVLVRALHHHIAGWFRVAERCDDRAAFAAYLSGAAALLARSMELVFHE